MSSTSQIGETTVFTYAAGWNPARVKRLEVAVYCTRRGLIVDQAVPRRAVV